MALPAHPTLPLADLKVLDFSWAGVGPITVKYLADHGATVLRVESHARYDVVRLGPPWHDGKPGIERSQFYASYNTSKLGIALEDRKSTRLNSSHSQISYAVFCLKKKKKKKQQIRTTQTMICRDMH